MREMFTEAREKEKKREEKRKIFFFCSAICSITYNPPLPIVAPKDQKFTQFTQTANQSVIDAKQSKAKTNKYTNKQTNKLGILLLKLAKT